MIIDKVHVKAFKSIHQISLPLNILTGWVGTLEL